MPENSFPKLEGRAAHAMSWTRLTFMLHALST